MRKRLRKLEFSPVKQKLPTISSVYILTRTATPCYARMLSGVVDENSAVAKPTPYIADDHWSASRDRRAIRARVTSSASSSGLRSSSNAVFWTQITNGYVRFVFHLTWLTFKLPDFTDGLSLIISTESSFYAVGHSDLWLRGYVA